ncbi:MAG: hypothetical protein GY866_05905 [Proteobacteria bacterium]|nr:hypothetical protein [Pseudomonadota bacterium]
MRLKKIHQTYKNSIQFIFVYNQEPHATDEWWLGQSRTMRFFHARFKARSAIDIMQPTTYEERRRAAVRCKKQLLGDIPLYVDGMNDRVKKLYTSRPTRIYFIGRDGKVVYNPGIGPYSFNPDYLEPELKKYLESSE